MLRKVQILRIPVQVQLLYGGAGIGGDINVMGSTVIGTNLTADTGKLAW